MTIEEAGEIILRDAPFIFCGECRGSGRWEKEDNFDYLRAVQLCSACEGAGYILRADYERACQVLELKPPSPFWI